MSKPLIVTVSGKARHGKDTTSNIMKNTLESKGKKVLRIAYADYLKFIAQKYLGWDGKKDAKGRELLQKFGTEKVRYIDNHFWVDTVIRFVDIIKDDLDYVIISDCRFPNEITRWEDFEYEVVPIFVERKEFDSNLTEEQKNHKSETALDGYDFVNIISVSSLEELFNHIQKHIIPVLLNATGSDKKIILKR